MQSKLSDNKNVQMDLALDSDKLKEQQLAADKMAAELLKEEGIDNDGFRQLKFSTGEVVEKSIVKTKGNKKKKKKKK